ncbi:MAG: GntR family transcriptional regulator [Chitinophagales bacterium]
MESRPRTALKQLAYEQLKERIISCQLMPGFVLSEQALAEELGMSRTPVREALVQLAQDSLVKISPRRGAFVAELSIQDIAEIFELREALETWVVRKIAGSVPVSRLEEFQAAFQRLAKGDLYQPGGYIEADEEFHRFLVLQAGNRRCETLFKNLQDQNQRIRILSTRQPGRLAETQTEHLAIVEALSQGNSEAAAAAMATHIRNARVAAMRLL